jgi:hypothetical protein
VYYLDVERMKPTAANLTLKPGKDRPMPTAILAPEIRCILESAIIEGNTLRIPMTLDRADYVAVNAALVAIGGKWSRKEQAHVFPSDPTDKVRGLYDGGKVPAKNPLAFFATPPEIVREMIGLACIPMASQTSKATRILEPSAGDGAIVRGLIATRDIRVAIQTVELDRDRAITLDNLCVPITCTDFLTWTPPTDRKTGEPIQYDRVLMNPPFSVESDKLAYIAHVRKAFEHLTPGGRLVAVVPSGVTFRSDRKTAAFRSWVEEHGTMTDLDAYSFKVSGTGVNTCLIVLDKPTAKVEPKPTAKPTRKPRAAKPTAKVETVVGHVIDAQTLIEAATVDTRPIVEPTDPNVALLEANRGLDQVAPAEQLEVVKGCIAHIKRSLRANVKSRLVMQTPNEERSEREKAMIEARQSRLRLTIRQLRLMAIHLRSKGINPSKAFKVYTSGLPLVFSKPTSPVKPRIARKAGLPAIIETPTAPLAFRSPLALPAPAAVKALPAPAAVKVDLVAVETPKPVAVKPTRKPVSIADYAPIRPENEPACFADDRPFALVSGPKGPVKKATAERRADLPGQRWMF